MGRVAVGPGLLPAVVLVLLFMAGCSQSSGTQQASEEQQRNEELQQQVDDLKKEQEEQKEQQQEEQQQENEKLRQENEDLKREQEPPPQVVVERNEVVGTAAPEGRVVITPDATYAGTTQEAAALDAAIAYYEAAELGDYAYTYDSLVGADRAKYSYEEWSYANEQLDSAAGEFVIFSVEETYTNSVRIGLTVYPTSGSPFDRYTDFVYENGTWQHSLTMEEYGLFDSVL